MEKIIKTQRELLACILIHLLPPLRSQNTGGKKNAEREMVMRNFKKNVEMMLG